MYQNILVPIDIAHVNEGRTSIETAATNLSEGGQITLLYVIEDIPSWVAAELPKGIRDKSAQSARAILEGVAGEFDESIKVDIRKGHSYQTILDVAEEQSSDLIVIASHRPGFKDFYLGSTAAKVVRHAKSSVHILR